MLVYVFALRGPGNPTNSANPYNPWVVGSTQGEAFYALRLPPAGARIRLEIAGGSCLAALGLGHGPRAFTATGITSVTGYVLPRRGVFWRCVLIDRGCVLKVCPGGAS